MDWDRDETETKEDTDVYQETLACHYPQIIDNDKQYFYIVFDLKKSISCYKWIQIILNLNQYLFVWF